MAFMVEGRSCCLCVSSQQEMKSPRRDMLFVAEGTPICVCQMGKVECKRKPPCKAKRNLMLSLEEVTEPHTVQMTALTKSPSFQLSLQCAVCQA